MKALKIRTLITSAPSGGAVRAGGALAAGVLLAALAVPPASAAAQPGGPYSGMGTCPLSSTALRNPANAAVGCGYSCRGRQRW